MEEDQEVQTRQQFTLGYQDGPKGRANELASMEIAGQLEGGLRSEGARHRLLEQRNEM